ncbi:hypothetical protein [Aquimarina algiphila]|uniref:Uncharacterized protein n=1 Tax=Aquimarina algiphila TaxID=2047982 RepID=A0A554VKT9_9FLAO|nr:hypothetical protein [Aquimarina algiphila]TSE08647.1 hypothetical protein FOF46_11900 [Aquimarina algiphila]
MDKILSPIKSRVLQYLDFQGIPKKMFFEKTGISPSNFKGKGGISEIGGEKIVSILTIFKNLDPSWLLLGEGNMIKKTKESTNQSVISEENTIEAIVTNKILKSISPFFTDIKKEMNMVIKGLGELRLDLDDIKEDYDMVKKEEGKEEDY